MPKRSAAISTSGSPGSPTNVKMPFDALVGEVRRELDLARLHSSRTDQ